LIQGNNNKPLPDLRRIYEGTDSAYEDADDIPDEQRESNHYIQIVQSQEVLGIQKISTHEKLYGNPSSSTKNYKILDEE